MTNDDKSQSLSDDPAMPKPGDLLKARYRIQKTLGEGGFAAVFSAFDTTTSAHVAIKILDPLMSRREAFVERFLREVETISSLTHYNTIRVTDKGETDTDCLFLVMELLEGDAIDVLLEERGPMPPALVRSVAIQVLRSLREAHSKNIIHRDIKPANIFLVSMPGDDVHVKVLDFGIAKTMNGTENAALTSTGEVMCSPHYVAPERISDQVTVPASDIYSLGVSMIEMLEGKPPYTGENPLQLVMKHAKLDEPVPMSDETLQTPLAAILKTATQKDYRKRYQSAQHMLDALKVMDGTLPFAGGAPPQTSSPTTTTSTPLLKRLWFVPVLLALLVVAALVAWTLVGRTKHDTAAQTPRTSEQTPARSKNPAEPETFPPADLHEDTPGVTDADGAALEDLDTRFGSHDGTPPSAPEREHPKPERSSSSGTAPEHRAPSSAADTTTHHDEQKPDSPSTSQHKPESEPSKNTRVPATNTPSQRQPGNTPKQAPAPSHTTPDDGSSAPKPKTKPAPSNPTPQEPDEPTFTMPDLDGGGYGSGGTGGGYFGQ